MNWQVSVEDWGESKIPVNRGPLWDHKQRQMHPIHYTVSYRGSFKPEVPHFFINNLLNKVGRKGRIVFDPFAGRGTTVIQANLQGHIGWGNDVNPLLDFICWPLTHPPTREQVRDRLEIIPFHTQREPPDLESARNSPLLAFYHPQTLNQLLNLRDYLVEHRDPVDRFIEVIALSRLHGHSPGFFSGYSFPQFSVPPKRQVIINQKHGDPVHKDVAKLILRKARRSLRGDQKMIHKNAGQNKLTTQDIRQLDPHDYPDESVDLVITSPPFLAQVDYITDNWLKYWFLRVESDQLKNSLVQTGNLDDWKFFITQSLKQIRRVLRPEAKAVIEVGDVSHKGRRLFLDEIVYDLGVAIGLEPESVWINQQEFTKLSNCFGVTNNRRGVNTNRCVVFQKAE